MRSAGRAWLLSVMAWGVALACVAGQAQAAYEPQAKVEESVKAKIKKGVAALKSLPAAARQAMMAERMGLLYSDGVGPAYTGRPKVDAAGFHFYVVVRGARYMGTAGKQLDFYTERSAARQKKFSGRSGNELWNTALMAIEHAGEEAVFADFSAELTKMTLQTVRHHVQSLTPEVRDAWLSELSGLLYMEDGSDAYGEEKSEERYGTIDLPRKATWREPKPDALFRDALGKEWRWQEVWEQKGLSGRVPQIMSLLHWCVALVGRDDVLALFPRELRALQK